ncbi:STAS domain-containing protein [Kitasatospora sp. NA04385]|uniref:STAS domain-containing protein n=1 Tax=Kitasatospora sp. NA04385 TaxID=2742135 RepID=UPI0015919AF5|nr:STAS domain-containing protein [Kitasatospora sp. NA04385]QKW17992.1 STAS domain-containing protein [Kitasatospora sp. NA04385]
MTDHPHGAAGTGPVDVETVRARGELDWEDAQDFVQRLTAVLDRPPRLLVVDLADVTFADSSVLHGLLTAHRRMAEAGGRLVLAGPLREPVRRLLDLASATGYLHVAADAEAAARCAPVPAPAPVATRPPRARGV